MLLAICRRLATWILKFCNATLKLADSVDREFDSNLKNKFARVYLSNRSLCTRVMYRTSELGRASSRVATSCWGIPLSAT